MRKQDHKFKKSLGQNFITDKKIVRSVLDFLDLSTEDDVVEIGPGDGRFSEEIINKVRSLKLIELDDTLVPFLTNKFEGNGGFSILHKDILEVSEDELPKGEYKVFGALPYNISKPIISKFIKLKNPPKQIVFIIQKEVAQDYTEVAPKASFLSNYVQIYADIEYKMTIGKEKFHPRPEVDGGVLLIKPIEKYLGKNIDKDELSKFIKNGFRMPRKKLMNTLKAIYHEVEWIEVYEKIKLNPNVRASELTIQDWELLYANNSKPAQS